MRHVTRWALALAIATSCGGERDAPRALGATVASSSASSSVAVTSGGMGASSGAGGAGGMGGGSACGDGEHLALDGACVADLCDGGDAKRVLFVGNSYTSANQLPTLVAGFAAAEACPLETDAHTPGGARFSDHAVDATLATKLAAGPWDVVVLQNQSQVPGFRPEDVLAGSVPHAVSLASAIADDSPQGALLYFQTWGRRDGDSQNCGYYPLVCTFDGHTEALAAGYQQYVDATGGTRAPVGGAWKDVVDDDAAPFASSELWSGDGSHPSARGSYLAAAVIFGRIFGGSPVGNPYVASLDPAEAGYLQQIAAPHAAP